MSSKPYTLLVLFEAKPGKQENLKEALVSLMKATLQEQGLINYNLHQSRDNPSQFMIYENWIDKEAHGKHMQTPHIHAWRKQKDELLAKPGVTTFWEKVE